MTGTGPADLTGILCEVNADRSDRRVATEQLYQAVYAELRRIAGALMNRERRDHTLQPTALVNEAYLRLVDQTRVQWEGRAHFFGIASRAMRQILVDHARRHGAHKRGGGWHRITLDENLPERTDHALEILELHEALEKLAGEDERMARVVELRIFGGLLAREAALVLGVSKRTVDDDWRVARMWLGRELAGMREA
jgi:RNA polymerase sigma factor (TIGR02999 family)